MTVTEESRHRLHQKLGEAIGPEEASTLMEHLPPVGWADVATKQDLAHLQEVVAANVDHRSALLTGDVDHRYRMLDAKIDGRYDQLDAKIDGIAALFHEIRKLYEAQDRRMEALELKLGNQIWQVTGLLAAIGLIVIGFAQVVG